MKTLRIVGRYVLRMFMSAPVIGAGILDVLLLILNALGINIRLPTWGYATFLGVGYLIENIRIFIELEGCRVQSDLVLGIYHKNQMEWGDSITINQSTNPDFRPSFGLVIAGTKPGIPVKGVVVQTSFYWRGGPPTKSITIRPPADDNRWKVVFDHITNQRPATLTFDGHEEIVTHAQPLFIPNLTFHVLEQLKGYILIKYEIASTEPPTAKSGEAVINLSAT